MEAQHLLEHTRQVRGAHMDPDSYTNRLPRAVKAKSERAPAGGEKNMFQKDDADWSIKQQPGKFDDFLVIDTTAKKND